MRPRYSCGKLLGKHTKKARNRKTPNYARGFVSKVHTFNPFKQENHRRQLAQRTDVSSKHGTINSNMRKNNATLCSDTPKTALMLSWHRRHPCFPLPPALFSRLLFFFPYLAQTSATADVRESHGCHQTNSVLDGAKARRRLLLASENGVNKFRSARRQALWLKSFGAPRAETAREMV